MMFGLLLASFETISSTLTLAIKLINDHPKVIQELTVTDTKSSTIFLNYVFGFFFFVSLILVLLLSLLMVVVVVVVLMMVMTVMRDEREAEMRKREKGGGGGGGVDDSGDGCDER